MGLGVVVVVGWGGGGGQAQQLRSAGTRRQRSTAAHRDAIPTPLTKTHPHRHPQLVSAHDLSSEACLPRVCASSPPLPSPLTGNIECVSCAIGFYGNVPGLGCFPAPAGTFVNTTGAYTPTPWCAPRGRSLAAGRGGLLLGRAGVLGAQEAGCTAHARSPSTFNPSLRSAVPCIAWSEQPRRSLLRPAAAAPPPPPPPPAFPPAFPHPVTGPPSACAAPGAAGTTRRGPTTATPADPASTPTPWAPRSAR